MSEVELKELILSTTAETRQHFDRVAGELRVELRGVEDRLRGEMRDEIRRLRVEIIQTRNELQHHIGILAERVLDMATKRELAELRAEFADVRGDMHAAFTDVQVEMRALKTELKAEIAEVRNLIRPN